jgi:hypothetical protein
MISYGHSLTFVINTIFAIFIVQIGIKNSDLCNFSKNDTDSILHYIWLCPVVKLFWNRVKTWLEEFFDIPIELKMANIVFITNVNECPFEIIEFVILFTKYYIHCCKWSNNLKQFYYRTKPDIMKN